MKDRRAVPKTDDHRVPGKGRGRHVLISVLLCSWCALSLVAGEEEPRYRNVGSVVRIDGQNRLIVNDVPFFPLAFYGPSDDEGLAKIAAAGYNTVLCYSFGLLPEPDEAREFLDRAQNHGLWVIYSLKDHYPDNKRYAKTLESLGLPKDTTNTELARIRHVEPLKDHPALLAWYIADEFVPLNSESHPHRRDYMLALQKMVHEVDPNHPTKCVTNHKWSKPPQYIGVTDIVTADPYPIPQEPLQSVADYVQELREGVSPDMPVWLCVQAFDRGIYNGVGNNREPTFSEIRCMTYLGLTHGVNGIMYYSFADLMRRAGRQNENPLNFRRRWAQMKCIAPELQTLSTLLLHGEEVPVQVQPAAETDAKALEQLSHRAIRHGGRLYLMLANAGEASLHCEISLLPGEWACAGYLQGAALSGEMKDGKLAVVIAPRNADTLILEPAEDKLQDRTPYSGHAEN